MNFWLISGLELEGGAQGEMAEMVNFLSVDTLFAPPPFFLGFGRTRLSVVLLCTVVCARVLMCVY